MAKLSEIPYVVRTVGPFTFLKRIYIEVGEDGVLNMAAAVAYYWLLALFPLVIFLASLATFMPAAAKQATHERVTMWIYTNLTKEAADSVWVKFDSMMKTPNVGLLSVGLLITLWAASNGMNATMTALDRCYNVTRPRPFVKQRGMAIAITLCGVFIVLLVGLLLPVTSAILNYLGSESAGYVPGFAAGGTRMALDVARYSIGITLVILLVSSIYQFGVSIRRRWTLITPGAVFAVFGVMGMAYGFNSYLRYFGTESYNKTYGALGGVVILLFLFYLYAVVFLIGAEINSEIDFAVLRERAYKGLDPLPEAHEPGEIEQFKRQLDEHGAKFLEVHSERAAVAEGTAESKPDEGNTPAT